MVNEFAGANFTCAANSTGPCIETGDQVLQVYGVADVVVWEWALVLIGMTIGYYILTFCVIKFLHKEKR